MRRCSIPAAVAGNCCGPRASQEFLLTLTEPLSLAVTEDPALRSILLRHRCHLTLLRDAGCASVPRSGQPLTSFALHRCRVRITGSDEASICRCCRQLGARFPEFANRTRVPAVADQQPQWQRRHLLGQRTAQATVGDISFPCLRSTSCKPFQPRHFLSNPVVGAVQKSDHGSYSSGSYSRKPIIRTASAIRANAVRSSGLQYPTDDKYSAFFTESDADLTSSYPPLPECEVNSDKSSVTCTTVIISVCDSKKYTRSQDPVRRIEPTEDRRPAPCGDKDMDKDMDKDIHKRGQDGKCRRRRPKVADVCVQTSPGQTADAGAQSSCQIPALPPAASFSRCYLAASTPGKSASSARRLVDVSTECEQRWNTCKPASRPKLACGTKCGPRLPGKKCWTTANRRVRGKVAHRRVTWFLRYAKMKDRE